MNAEERSSPLSIGGILAVGMAALFVLALTFAPAVWNGETVTLRADWMPQIGLTFVLNLDGLSLLFVLLITGIGAGVMLYAGTYFEETRKAANFLALMVAFSAAMLLLVLAGNLMTLFIGWELTSIISFLLIGFNGRDPNARRGANMALIITGGGGLALLAGLLLMGAAAGTHDIATILSSGEILREHPHYGTIAILIMIGCFTKSAQFPFHFWLPNAMTAPTPASAFLHSATMVKAGIYLLLRFAPVLGETAVWQTALIGIGLVTMALGAVLALKQRDLKGALAYSTISQLGALVALIGLPHGEGLTAALVGIVAHALYKGALFLIVGAIDHSTGTRNLDELGGLRRQMPAYALVTGIAALSMAGVPPLLNFVGKEVMLDAYLHGEEYIMLAIVWFSAALTVAMGLILLWDVFFKPQPATSHLHFHVPHRLMIAAPAALAVLSIVGGLLVDPLLSPAVSAARGESLHLHLFPPEGLTTVFWISMAAIAAGIGIFLVRGIVRRVLSVPIPSGAMVYRAVMGGAETFGEERTHGLVERAGDLMLELQSGKIRRYLGLILAAAFVLLLPALLTINIRLPNQSIDLRGTGFLKLVLLGLSVVATYLSIRTGGHLTAAVLLGVSGYAIGGIFLLEPAPDVALVQFLIETLGTVLVVLILARTPLRERREAIVKVHSEHRLGKLRDMGIAIAVGAAVTVFALAAVGSRPTPNPLAAWYIEHAYAETGATDVVGAIVTDFRGMDTMIEITVFGLAAIGVLVIITQRRGSSVSIYAKPAQPDQIVYERTTAEMKAVEPVFGTPFSDSVTRVVTNLILPIALLIALGHLLYGGGAPGDGFTAGVIGGLGVAMIYIVYGYEEAQRRTRWLRRLTPLIAIGILIAFGNAALPLLFGREFLAHTSIKGFEFAGISLHSSLIFELGIFLAVFGGVRTIMDALAHPKEVEIP